MTSRAAERSDWVLNLEDAVGDEHAASSLRVLRERLLEPGDFLVVDLSSAPRLDGGHLALLLAASRDAARPFAVVVSSNVADSLREWRFDTHLRTFDGMDAALAALGKEAQA